MVAVAAGVVAGSVSLVGFGFDSFIEVVSGVTLFWRMAVDADASSRERNEKLGLRIVGISFIALAGYISYAAISGLARGKVAEHSAPGIILACLSLVVMPILSRAKRKVGIALASYAMEADATQTDFCAYLSAILLVGLLLNAALGWWWADSASALVMAPIIAKEGIDTLTGNTKCESCP